MLSSRPEPLEAAKPAASAPELAEARFPSPAALARSGPVSVELLESARASLAQVRPGDLDAVAPVADALLARLGDPAQREPARRALLGLLDGVRRRSFTALLEPGIVQPWVTLVLRVLRGADYTFGDMLRSREETDPRTVALRVLGPEECDVTVAELARRTRALARGVLALVAGDPEARVAILSEQCLDAALCDVACLSNGIANFPLPANAVAEQVVYMLRHSGARVLLASDAEQVAKVLPSLAALPDLREVVVFSTAAAERHGLLSLAQMVAQGSEFDDAERAARAAAVRAGDVATVMYTSGTTGKPKGIVFTQENIVAKRFCRAFALPQVGEGDVFLCYLPPYHTFGRYLELCGTLFWGATYVFARSPVLSSLLEDFAEVRPTVFASVPKKWMELHDAAAWDASADDPEALRAHLRALTGGRLRFGLSAAGYLDPAVFRAFQGAGTDLCSGYGMTEATGGITMTPPGEYLDGSIGKPLPGIECQQGEGGELLVRGPYVSPGYFRPGPEEQERDAEGWFGTGDLVTIEPNGHYRITGRRKEIYKNRQGQTIAPQRVENLFRDFEPVAQAFLVGDQREYSTLLVWPNPASPSVAGRAPEAVRELLSSLVASANRFLAPFERVVAFQVLPRALDEAHGELTHKHTFKREAVERNWSELVERMYEQRSVMLPVEGGFLRIPTWVLREIGVLQQGVSLEGGLLQAGGRRLAVGAAREAPGALRLGDLAYGAPGAVLDLGAVLARPALWLGNESLRRFLGEEAFTSAAFHRRKGTGDLWLDPRCWPAPPPQRAEALAERMESVEPGWESLHAAAELLRGERREAVRALQHLQACLASERVELGPAGRALLRRAADSPDEEVRRRAFRALLPNEEPADLLGTVALFIDRMGFEAFRGEDLADLGDRGLGDAQVQALLAHLGSERARAATRDPAERRLLVGAMRLLAATGIAHPSWFAAVRVALGRLTLHEDAELAARANEELDRLRRGFWNWIGPNLRLAIDPASGAEYGWKEVVTFDGGVAPASAQQILEAIQDSTLVRGSVFLLGRGVLLSLGDIPPAGIRVSLVGRQHGKGVYRLSIRTRANESFDVAINVAEEMRHSELRKEVSWLLAAAATPPLVEQFGGCFAEWGMYTEEFIPGDTVEKEVARLVRAEEARRLESLWPFLAWNALEGHVRFWDRTGRRVALREPFPAAFIVPPHDYLTGARLVSVSDRSACATLDELLDRFRAAFVDRIEASRPELRGIVDEELLLSAVLEALGEQQGTALLAGSAPESRRAVAIETFLERLRRDGFTPQRVWFAVRRYRRWLEVNPAATVEARGTMLAELWGTYRLAEVERTWPDARLRFYRQTVFAAARPELGAALDRLMAAARSRPEGGLDLGAQVAVLRTALVPTAEEDWFLARMTYRTLAPTDDVALIAMPTGGRTVAEVVTTLSTTSGERFAVRGPVSPREVARLLQLFLDANLPVTFTGEHEFLLCFDEKEVPIGGLYYRPLGPDRVHLEKLVVARAARGGGVADGLVREHFRRLRERGVRRVETGYFQPEYLSQYGFRTDPSSGGLVRDLDLAAPGGG